ncbi:MAG: helix-turn-helix domain-containing protein, partial [Chloroflexi bacterium]|nr:helix-turn-helix domain-containing protein [Chloroflexota bacterium]
MLTFDRWLRRRRKAFDLTQEQIARQIGCSVETIRKIEAGERRPSRQIAELLAQTLQLAGAERDLFVRIARMEPGLQQDAQVQALPPFPLPPAPAPAPPAAAPTPGGNTTATSHSLPQPPALIGREHEIAQLCAYLQRADVRLLNLIGPGGIGKTSLALHVAAELSASFSGGVVFVPLAALADAALVIPTIAHALGVQHRDQEDLTTQIAVVLRDAALLLVLDNFEHLL